MRIYFVTIICLFTLTGCIHYSGKRSSAIPYNPQQLSKPHVYHYPKFYNALPWWDKFHDPQLNRLIKIGLSDSPNFKKAVARFRAAQAMTQLNAASLWPEIEFRGIAQRFHFPELGFVPPPFNGRTFDIEYIGLNFKYEIDFWGRNQALIAASVSKQCAALAEIAEAKLLLSSAIGSTYFQLQSNTSQLHMEQIILALQQKLLKIIVQRTEHGIASAIPIKQAQLNVQMAALNVKKAQQLTDLTRNQLAILIGKNPLKTHIIIRPFQYQPYVFYLPNKIPANILSHRPDVIAARERACAEAHQINVSKARFFPNINLNGLYGFQTVVDGTLFEGRNRIIGGGLALDLPIFDAGARRADLAQHYALYDVAVNEYNQTILNALRDTANQISTLRTTQVQIKTQDLAVRATENNAQLTESRFHHGIIDYEQVLEIKSIYWQQKLALLNLQTQHLKAIVNLYKALGGYDQG